MLTVALIFVTLGVSATQATVCKTNTDCGAGECCYIEPEFMVVSRQINLFAPTHHDTGVCEAYHAENDNCFPLETANGHCGCTPGTSCQFVPAATLAPLVAQPISISSKTRRSIYMPGPGTFNCVKV